jgi:hypothetical protein
MRRDPRTFDRLPLYATDEDIGEAVLGVERRAEFKSMIPSLDGQGLPPFSKFFGGRYVPAVARFFQSLNGMADATPNAPHGIEDTSRWQKKNVRNLRG